LTGEAIESSDVSMDDLGSFAVAYGLGVQALGRRRLSPDGMPTA
jgi:hypothetical protein